MLCHATGENLFFDEDVRQSGVFFGELMVAGNVLVKYLGGCSRLAISCGVSIIGCPLDVCFLLADGVLCHLQSVPKGHAVGEEVAESGLGQVSLRPCRCPIIEPHIVGDDCLDVVLFAKVADVQLGVDIGDDLSFQILDLLPVLGDFLGVVGGLHKVVHAVENFVDDEGESFVDVAVLVVNCSADVVDHRVVKGVRRFGVDCEIVGTAAVNFCTHCVLSLGVALLFNSILIIHYDRKTCQHFFSNWINFFCIRRAGVPHRDPAEIVNFLTMGTGRIF